MKIFIAVRVFAVMPVKGSEIISISKLKKGGQINSDIRSRLINTILSGDIIAMPVDFIYGFVCAADTSAEARIISLSGKINENIIRIVSSFKMLEQIAIVDKFQFDFLHRVWPGEVIVLLKRITPSDGEQSIPVIMPKNRFVRDITDAVEKPLLFTRGFRSGKFFSCDEGSALKKYREFAGLIVVIDELCKEHPPPTIVDLSGEEMKIVHEGKISIDEIKSLYFLDTD